MKTTPLFGVCTSNLAEIPLLRKIGYDYFEASVGEAMQPDLPDDEWKARRDAIMAAPLPLRACNGFLPGRFRLTGPTADHAPALDYAVTACRRADELGCKYIVFGSGGARNVPCVFGPDATQSYDIEGGRDQFAAFCAALAERIADCSVTVVIEPLRPGESNIVQYVWQGLQIVEEINSPRIRQLADIYHMMRGREGADSLLKAGDRLQHCHIATSKGRLFPGAYDDVSEFVPYFDALAKIGYTGGISCECGWNRPNEETPREAALETALATMRKLA